MFPSLPRFRSALPVPIPPRKIPSFLSLCPEVVDLRSAPHFTPFMLYYITCIISQKDLTQYQLLIFIALHSGKTLIGTALLFTA